MKEFRTQATTRMNRQDVMLGETSSHEKTSAAGFHLYETPSQIHGERKQNRGRQGVGEKGLKLSRNGYNRDRQQFCEMKKVVGLKAQPRECTVAPAQESDLRGSTHADFSSIHTVQ